MIDVISVLAPNPGRFTGAGTNSYVIATPTHAVVLDPGPRIPSHIEALVDALGGRNAAAILVTHHHPDHAPAANPLGERLGAPVMGYEPGPDFSPDITIADGDEIQCGETSLVAVHTPGHTADHLCYVIGDLLFTGDHIMGGSTVVIEDAASYMQSLERVLAVEPGHIYPGHGPEIPDAMAAVRRYIDHRLMRERQVIDAVRAGARSARDIVAVVYHDVDPALHFAAEMQVNTMVSKLAREGRVSVRPDADGATVVSIAEDEPA